MKKMRKLLACLSTVTLIIACDKTGTSDSSSISDSSNNTDSVVSSNSSTLTDTDSFDHTVSNSNSSVSSNSSTDSNSNSSSNDVTHTIVVNGVRLSNAYTQYKNSKSGLTSSERSKFFVLEKDYLVGDDNAFNIKPEISFFDVSSTGDIVEVDVESWEFEITLSRFVENKFVVETDASYVDSIDNVNCLIDLSEKAIGEKFKIDVVPTGLTENQKNKIDEYTVSYEVNVIDGYNVYDAKEMAYMNNSTYNMSDSSSFNKINEKEVWDAFKTSNNLKLDYYPANLILHKNIVIEDKDIPSQYFFSDDEIHSSDLDYDRALGSLKDWNELYYRILSENETFNIYGNYFTLDASNISLVTRQGTTPQDEDKAVTSHATLFKIVGNETNKASFNDINFVGNSQREENIKFSGGLIMNKIEHVDFTVNNSITTGWFISFMPNRTDAPYTMDHCKAYDNFTCFVYNWGSKEVTIKDCEFIGAGGPVIIQDHVGHDDNGNGGNAPQTIIDNSNVQSYVTGTEGWFYIVGANALVPQIKALDNVFLPAQRAFLKSNSDATNTFFNFICVNKSGSAETVTTKKVSGELSFNTEDTKYSFNYGLNNPYIAGMLSTPALAQAPIFETSAGGACFTDAKTGLFDYTNTPINYQSDNAMFKGNYLCTYFMGMALVLSYGPAGGIYSAN